jgi:hydroxymethylbilane synthase
VGQGALGIEARHDDARVAALIAPLDHAQTAARVKAERAMNKRLQGGCQVPIAGFAELQGDVLSLRGLVGAVDGRRIIADAVQGKVSDAEQLGVQLAEKLLAAGAGDLLAEVYGSAASV